LRDASSEKKRHMGMRDGSGDRETRPQSKFEWRPEDVTTLSEKEGDVEDTECEKIQREDDVAGEA